MLEGGLPTATTTTSSQAPSSGGRRTLAGIWPPEHHSIVRQDIVPKRLTTGPLRFGAPTPSSDGKRIFAVGDESRVELFSYDPHAQRFDSYLGGLSAGPVAFSPDERSSRLLSGDTPGKAERTLRRKT